MNFEIPKEQKPGEITIPKKVGKKAEEGENEESFIVEGRDLAYRLLAKYNQTKEGTPERKAAMHNAIRIYTGFVIDYMQKVRVPLEETSSRQKLFNVKMSIEDVAQQSNVIDARLSSPDGTGSKSKQYDPVPDFEEFVRKTLEIKI